MSFSTRIKTLRGLNPSILTQLMSTHKFSLRKKHTRIILNMTDIPTKSQVSILNGIQIFNIVMFCVIIIWSSLNVYRLQTRIGIFKGFYITTFYTLAFLVLLCSTFQMIYWYRYNNLVVIRGQINSGVDQLVGNELCIAATYLSCCIGFF